MTFRAVEVLKSVDMIVAEDTRHSRTLLDHYDVRTACSSYHEHNEASETPRLLDLLRSGKSIALITDAGTPLLSDPGARLTFAVSEAGLQIIPVPGANALLPALVASGISADQFTFLGFLPRKGKERQRDMELMIRSPIATVFYEAPGRVADTLEDISKAGAGLRWASVSRELTKKFEETRRGTVDDLHKHFSRHEARGEFVIVVAGAEAVEVSDDVLQAYVAGMRAEGKSAREITDGLMARFGTARNRAYKLAHE